MINPNSTIAELNAMNRNTLMEQLGIEYIEVTDGYVYAKMPVNERTKQPMGILHGGSSLALAETVGSLGSAFIVDLDQNDVRGSHMSANHVRAAKNGWVYAKAVIIHRGRNTHVWNIDIFDDDNQLVSTCRLTNFIIAKSK
ncbi:MAG: PaaI family thioesterase [Bacteroidetes bacterium]|nr:PaaI family thioesterase [Bacteroidales bacterium]MBU1009764.1 PaaI family thioesterase [Bacteroidota bacterium]